jgi:hypothetical protein
VSTKRGGSRGPGPIKSTLPLLNALDVVERLLVLDDIWSDYLSTDARASHEPDFAGLRQLATQMDRELGRSRRVAARVRDALQSREDEDVTFELQFVRDRLAQAMQAADWRQAGGELQVGGLVRREPRIRYELTPDRTGPVGWLLQHNSRRRPAREVMIAACNHVERHAWDERAILSAKAMKLESHELPDPDLSPLFRCAWTVVGIGAIGTLAAAGAVATLGVLPVAGLGTVGALFTLSTVWGKSGCSQTWDAAAATF